MAMQNLLEGRVAVVTGVSRGIGRAIAETLTHHGTQVFGSVRTMDDTVSNWADTAGVTLFELDLADEASIKNAIKLLRQRTPDGLDILVNNAGMPHGALFQMTRVVDLKEVFEVNFFGQIAFTQGLARHIARRKRGSIVNIASTAAMIPDPGTLAYGASKAAFARATQSLAMELGPQAIRVNTVAPGVTRTEMLEKMDPKALEKRVDHSMLKRIAEPQDIANAVLFLASDLSSHVTGQVLRVDGGAY